MNTIVATFSRSKFRNILSGIWLIALFISTLEVAARFDDWVRYDASFFKRYEFDQLYRLTATGLRGVPNARYTRWILNEDGLRGTNLLPDQGQTRVVTYGASETFGMFEDRGSEFPQVLEKELNKASNTTRFEVLNAGLPGMRVGSGVGLFRELAEKYDLKVVVIYPTPTHYIGVSEPYCQRLPKSGVIPTPFWPQLRITDKLREEVKRSLPTKVQHFLREVSITWQTRNILPIERLPDASIQAFEFDLKCALDGAKAVGMLPILVTHANRFGEMRHADEQERLIQWRLQYPEMHVSGFIDLERRANNSIRTIALAEQVKLVDADATLSGNPKWFADHAHFNNEGAAQMGALLASAILKSLGRAPQ